MQTKDERNAVRRAAYARNPRRAAANRDKRKWRYRITAEEYVHLMSTQYGRCAICRGAETATMNGTVMMLAVDHDHETGEIRGLLCHACNIGLGKFRDNPIYLAAAQGYLLNWVDHKKKGVE